MKCYANAVLFRLIQGILCYVSVPVIGIGAGVDTDGQVLVMHDMLGVHTRKPAKFVKDFLSNPANESRTVQGAFELFHQEVKNKTFPSLEHTFN